VRVVALRAIGASWPPGPKLGVRDRTAAVAFALRAELIDWLDRFGVLKFRLVGPSC
jgi:hypothetical protein